MNLRNPPDETARQLLEHVDEFGWSVIGREADSLGPAYAYTVGLWETLQHPEIVVVGLDSEQAMALLNRMGDAIKVGQRFEPGQSLDGYVARYALKFVAVHPANVAAAFGYASWYYGNDGTPMIQCLWPDAVGRYPDEEKFDDRFRDRQPLLDRAGDAP